jgi:hypothetical protein
MKYFLFLVVLLISSCNKQPYPAPPTHQTTWLDVQTKKDTIITYVNNKENVINYSVFHWQQLADSSRAHGYRLIAIQKGDSIWVKPINDPSSNYKGPYLLHLNESRDTLKAQNFLDTSAVDLPRTFILMK